MEEIKPSLEILKRSESFPAWSGDPQAVRSAWDQERLQAANIVSIKLERLGYMVHAGLINEEHFLGLWGSTISRTWDHLEYWVKLKRHDNGEPTELAAGAFSRKHFELLAITCHAFSDALHGKRGHG